MLIVDGRQAAWLRAGLSAIGAALALLATACSGGSHPKGSAAAANCGRLEMVARDQRISVLAWGYNEFGQLGDGTTTNSDVPVKVKLPEGTKVTEVSGGGLDGLVLTSTGSVLAWGYNGDGQLGDGNKVSSDVPVEAKLPKRMKVTAIAGGGYHNLALTSSGAVLAWGEGNYGEVGDGSTKSSDVPVTVKLPKGTKVIAISAGKFDSLALTSAGSVLAWGYNGLGALGDGNTKSTDVPVKVKLPRGVHVIAIAGGAYHSLALTSKGSVLSWGDNINGQLGDGKTKSSDVPVQVKLPKGTQVTAVAAGVSYSLALTSTGSLLAWGVNLAGQLGDGTTTQSDVPVRVKLPRDTKATAVAAGGYHALALTSAGSVLAWGANIAGQLGDGTTTQSDVPVKVKLPRNTAAIAVRAGSTASWSAAEVTNSDTAGLRRSPA